MLFFSCGCSLAIIALQSKGKYFREQLTLEISSGNLANQLCCALTGLKQGPARRVPSSAS